MAGSLLALQKRSGQSHALPSYWGTTLTNGSSGAVALFAGVGILQGTAHSEHRVATAHFPTFSVARGSRRVLLTPVKALVTELRGTGLQGPAPPPLSLRSPISCPLPLLCDREGLTGLGMVVWQGVGWGCGCGKKRAGGVVKQELQPRKAFGKEARQQQVNHHGALWQWCWLRAEAGAEGSNLPWGEAGWVQRQGREPSLGWAPAAEGRFSSPSSGLAQG